MSRRAIGVSVISIILAYLAVPVGVHAEQCGPTSVTATGFYFSAYESPTYSPEGYLAMHFKNASTSARSVTLGTIFYADGCGRLSSLGNTSLGNTYPAFTIPAGVTDWSVRFTSISHFEIWDDLHGTMIASVQTPVALPPYTIVEFAATESLFNNNSTLFSRGYQIKEGEVPPIVENKLDPATLSPCPAGTGSGSYFDYAYQRAEYIDGLLRVHLRRNADRNGPFQADVFGYQPPEDCGHAISNASSLVGFWTPTTTLAPYERYFSLRMASATHWEIWNDETDTKLTCDHCAGDIPAGSPYVFLVARNSELRTTMYPPAEPAPAHCTPGVDPDCNSNVMFLPGTEASRLYRSQVGVETKVWEPDGDENAELLAMTDDGDSLNQIYTKTGNVIDYAYFPIKGNIYKSFIRDMDRLVTDSKINAWEAVPYDWRFSVDHLLTTGTQTGDNISYLLGTSSPYIKQELLRLAKTSRTGKVTIVAHSNGGLIAKALMLDLGQELTAELVDKVILIASPQVGTPQAIAAFLHGDDQGLPFEWYPYGITPQTARTLMRNMPGPYLLLPTNGYFTYVDDPVITFDGAWEATYGSAVHSVERLDAFMNDVSRPIPLASDLNTAAITHDGFFDAAQALHENLDSWSPPAAVELVQIAGWGIPTTLKGIDYDSDAFEFSASTTIDGDGTVVVPSALWTSVAPNVSNYWVNLRLYNRGNIIESSFGFTPLKHSNILEVNEARSFVIDILADQPKPLADYTYLTVSAPVSTDHRLRYELHSPLTLDVYDTENRHTGVLPSGEIEEQIPGTYYAEIGGVKYLYTDTSLPLRFEMDGYANGIFTFRVFELQGDTSIATTAWKDMPVTTTTKVELDVTSDISTLSPLRIDVDGDGSNDIEAPLHLNGETTLYNFVGFFQPINEPSQPVSVFKAGSTIPVKFQLKNSEGQIVQAAFAPQWLTPQRGASMSAAIGESTYATTGTTGTDFKWDPIAMQYLFNWSTKGLQGGYWYKISTKLDDGSIHSVTIGLK